MIYSILAGLIAITHGALVILLFASVPFALFNKLKKWPWFEKIYIALALLVITSFILTGGCYFTDIEQMLWKKANSSYYYTGGYISHYLGFVGIGIADKVVYWLLVSNLVLGLGSYLLRYIIKFLTTKAK